MFRKCTHTSLVTVDKNTEKVHSQHHLKSYKKLQKNRQSFNIINSLSSLLSIFYCYFLLLLLLPEEVNVNALENLTY